MNVQLTLGNETYATNDAGASITTLENVSTLKAGSYLALVDNKVSTTAAPLAGARIQFIVGLVGTSGNMQKTIASVPILKKDILGYSHDVYAADVKAEWTLNASTLTVDSEGEAKLVLSDHTYSRTIQKRKVVVYVTKAKGEAVAAFLQRVVDKINAAPVKGFMNKFVTATLAVTTITLKVEDANIDFTVSRDGLFKGLPLVNSVKAKPSTSQTDDLIASEKEYSGTLGNGNYVERTDAWFSMPLQTQAGVNYDIFNIRFQGKHDTPQNKVNSAVMHLKLAIPTAKGAAFNTFLKALIANVAVAP